MRLSVLEAPPRSLLRAVGQDDDRRQWDSESNPTPVAKVAELDDRDPQISD